MWQVWLSLTKGGLCCVSNVLGKGNSKAKDWFRIRSRSILTWELVGTALDSGRWQVDIGSILTNPLRAQNACCILGSIIRKTELWWVPGSRRTESGSSLGKRGRNHFASWNSCVILPQLYVLKLPEGGTIGVYILVPSPVPDW